jgi:hypothetical protein
LQIIFLFLFYLSLTFTDKITPELVSRRGIYKDTIGSPATHVWAEYQLRPNQCVAMAVAPELFPPHNALSALKIVCSLDLRKKTKKI